MPWFATPLKRQMSQYQCLTCIYLDFLKSNMSYCLQLYGVIDTKMSIPAAIVKPG